MGNRRFNEIRDPVSIHMGEDMTAYTLANAARKCTPKEETTFRKRFF